MENKIQYRRKDNTKGIRITENNIKGWVRDKRTGSRRYSNTINIDKDMFETIKQAINNGSTEERNIISVTNNNTKFEFNTKRMVMIIKQFNVSVNSRFRYIIVEI